MVLQAPASGAPYVCINCKLRKKACDKKLPSCTYCAKKGVVCQYPDSPSATAYRFHPKTQQSLSEAWSSDKNAEEEHTADKLAPSARSDLLLLHSASDHAHLLPLTSLPQRDSADYNSIVHKRVYRLLQTTGLSLGQIHGRYLSGLHKSLPVILKDQFVSYQDSFVSSVPPAADISILMLATSIIVVDDSENVRTTQLATQESLYLVAKMLYAQVQAFTPPSLPLVQAGVLISIFEYLTGRCQAAILSIVPCGVMLQALDNESESASRPASGVSEPNPSEILRWCILVCERVNACEIGCKTQLLALKFPGANITLPSDPGRRDSREANANRALMLREIATSGPGLPCTIQSAWLLDQVLNFIELPPPINSHWSEACAIDQDLHSFLNTALQLDANQGGCCNAVANTVRAMFKFHTHIVNMTRDNPELKEWEGSSRKALDTAATIIGDVACLHADGHFLTDVNTGPPACRYAARVALDYLQQPNRDVERGSFSDSEEMNTEALHLLISRIAKRWKAVH